MLKHVPRSGKHKSLVISIQQRETFAKIGEIDVKDAELRLCEGDKRKRIQLLSELNVIDSKIESL